MEPKRRQNSKRPLSLEGLKRPQNFFNRSSDWLAIASLFVPPRATPEEGFAPLPS
jgi:hypothetical protein